MSCAVGVQGRDQVAGMPCVAQLNSPADRLAALLAVIAAETEPIVTLTHLLQLCRDEHVVLWERVTDPDCQGQVAATLSRLGEKISANQVNPTLDKATRLLLATSLNSTTGVPPVVVAHALAQFLDDHYAHTFTQFFRDRIPYQPAIGDQIPLDFPNLRALTPMPFTSPPWRLANRLDQTRHIRLAGDWAVQYRLVFDYSLADALAGLITADTVIATCHPNRSVTEFSLPRDLRGRTFPIRPIDLDRQRNEINRLIGIAVEAGADIVVLPELCVTEELATELQHWVRRPNGPRLLVVGSYHHRHRDEVAPLSHRKRNTALVEVVPLVVVGVVYLDMTFIVGKKQDGKTYYYLAESARVGGKPRIVSQRYLGSAEEIAARLSETWPGEPDRTRHLAFGDLAAVWGMLERLGVAEIIDDVVGSRRGDARASVGTYIALAVANRLVDPCSKLAFAKWWATTGASGTRWTPSPTTTSKRSSGAS